MATFTIITAGKKSSESPIVGDFNLYLSNRVDTVLTPAMFTTSTKPAFSDPNDNAATDIKILSLPNDNILLFNNSPVTINQEISIADITAGLLTYDAPDQDTTANNNFTFTVKSSGEYAEDTGKFVIISARVIAPTNHPPLVSNANADLIEETYQFNLIDFTTDFIDHNGDSYQLVKIETLPSIGQILYNSVPVNAGDAIDLADINNLTFEMPGTMILSNDGYCEYDQDVDTLIASYTSQGYTVDKSTKGILKFTKNQNTELPNNTDIYAFFDATSMKIEDAQSAQKALNAWYLDFTNTNPSFTGSLYILPVMMENWVGFPEAIVRGSLAAVGNNSSRPNDNFMAFSQIPAGFDVNTNDPNAGWTAPKEVLVLAFIDEVDSGSNVTGTAYHRNRQGYGFDQQPTAQYLSDYKGFVEAHATFDFFKGIFYPIPDIDYGSYNNTYNACVLQGFAAIEGGATYTLSEIEALGVTYVFERRFHWHLDPNHANYSGSNAYVANPYSKEAHTPVPNTAYELQGLKNFGWAGSYDKDQPASNVFSIQTFTDDLNSYLQGTTQNFTDVKVVEGTCYPLAQLCFNFSTSDDSAQQLYSSPATFCFNISGQSGNAGTGTIAPTVDNNSVLLRTMTYVFGQTSFVKNFADGDGDAAEDVIIKSLPRIGTLKYLGNPITIGQRFLVINSGILEFHVNPNYIIDKGIVYEFSDDIDNILSLYKSSGYELSSSINGVLEFTKGTSVATVKGKIVSSNISFNYVVTDNSVNKLESNTATFTFTPEGNINIPTPVVNQPPVVGDFTINTEYNAMLTLYRYVFTDTQPKYSDPEGDQPYKLKVLSLPVNGQLLLRGVPVQVGQILDFIDDIDSGDFKFDPDDNIEYFYEVEFDFTISDTVSKKFA